MIDKQLSFDDLWAAADEYVPQTEMSLQEQIKYKRETGWVYLTEDEVRNAKTFDNKPYGNTAGCDDLIETKREEEDPDELDIVFSNDLCIKHPTIKLYEKADNDELYLLIDGEDKFIFWGYEDRVVNIYEHLIMIGGKEQIIIYDTNKKLVTRLN